VAAGSLTRRKTIEESVAGTEEEGFRLKRELRIFDVIVFGIVVMIGGGTTGGRRRGAGCAKAEPHERRPTVAAGVLGLGADYARRAATI
jgi:hypothetical protein